MTAPVVNDNILILENPLVIRKMTILAGNTETALTHGGPAVVPLCIFGNNTTASPTLGTMACTAKSTTTITLDFQDDTNETWEVYVVFSAAAAGGIS